MSNEDENTVFLNCEANEVFLSTQATQYFTNLLSNPIELSINFPIKQEIQLNNFVVTIGSKTVISKILPKEKAEEKYDDSISSGNTGFIGNYNTDGDSYNVIIGNILPKEKIILQTSFLQLLTSNDMSYEFSIMEHYPSFQYKEMNRNEPDNKTIKGKITLTTSSKITRLISFFLDEENIKSTIKYENDNLKAIIDFEIPSNQKKKIPVHPPIQPGPVKPILLPMVLPSQPNFIKNKNIQAKSFIRKSDDIQPFFNILFRTEKMNTPMIYSQYNPERKEYSYVCNYVYSSDKIKEIPIGDKIDEDNKISYYNTFQNNENDTPGLFIFLIDQSGSMSGKPINLVKQALLLFIQSLPPKSYFQLIGFGSQYKYYNEKPIEYNKENVQNIIEVINNLSANMGGTNISGPLKDIFASGSYSNINLAKNIFLLTDGQVHDREECINCISANNSRFRIQAIGIGNNFDKILIERCGKIGKGSSSFVVNIEELNHIVIDTLNKCLRPYLTNINFDIKGINKIHIMPSLDEISYQDDIINYAFISTDKNEGPIDINLKANDTIKDVEKNFNVDKIISLEVGDQLSKIIISNLLKNKKDMKIEDEIKLSKEYQVLSKNTSLFGELLKEGLNTEGELIKVELNQNNKHYLKHINAIPLAMSNNAYRGIGVNFASNYMMSDMTKGAMPKIKKMSLGSLMPMKKAMKAMNAMPMNKKMNAMPMRKEKKKMAIDFMQMEMPMEMEENMMPMEMEKHKDLNPKIMSKKMEKNDTNYLSNLLMGQDIIEGFWDENNFTNDVVKSVQEQYNKIESYINSQNDIKEKKKAIYTTIVLYYLLNNMKEKVDELRLIINKGKKYLNSINYPYDDILQKVGL